MTRPFWSRKPGLTAPSIPEDVDRLAAALAAWVSGQPAGHSGREVPAGKAAPEASDVSPWRSLGSRMLAVSKHPPAPDPSDIRDYPGNRG